MKTVVLFDIDGTLLLSNSAGRVAMESALKVTFGATGPSSYRYDGKTDKLIVRETMRLEGFSDAEIDARMDRVIALYLAGLRDELASGRRNAYALPGIYELVDAVEAADDLVLGLLTGNVLEGAGVKLRAVSLAPERFVLGAFEYVAGQEPEHEVVRGFDRIDEFVDAGQRVRVATAAREFITEPREIQRDHTVHPRIDLGVAEAFEAHRLAHDQLVRLAVVAITAGSGRAERRLECGLHRHTARAVREQQRTVDIEQNDRLHERER
jgi:phosphoglycolate phosphatase-like HAD superfamily hydrolase